MHRFFLPPAQCDDARLVLTGREAHHGLHVLRLRAGDRLVVLDGAGHEYFCEATGLRREAIELAVIRKHTVPALPYQVTLLQAVPKGKGFENILQKATELGAYRVVPLLSERVVPHLAREKVENRLEKWNAVAIDACKQCGSTWLPQIDSPTSIKAHLERWEKSELPLIAALQGESRHPREWFKKFCSEHKRPPRSVAIWVGPEGDFTPTELSDITSAGALPITLGPLVLRSETAASYCLSVVSYELQGCYA